MKIQKELKKLVGALVISIMAFLIIKEFTELKIIERISVGLIIGITTFIFFKIVDLFTINKKLEKVKSQISFGKMNLIILATHIEINQYGKKRVIFLSQLTKCILINDVLFFIEKNKKLLPVKVNKLEMSNNSFDDMINRIDKLRIRIEK